jgi:UDP-N-acetylmuramate dehydrogenase
MKKTLPQIRGKYRFDVEIGKMCWFGTGGKASVVFIPSDLEDLIFFLQNKDKEIPIFVFGVGSNLLVRDGGFDGVIIRLGGFMNFMEKISDDSIRVGASVLDQNASNFAMENSIGGLEFLSGIPGTIGGGLAMNGGAYGSDFNAIVQRVQAITFDGQIIELSNSEMGFQYRKNSIPKDTIFLSCELQGYICERQQIIEKMNQIKTERSNTQPVKGFKTGGSTFKNPQGFSAWKLIDEAGCRGLKIGGAQVSELHCNFFINDGSATAADIENLVEEVQSRVFKKSGIMLEREIIIIGQKI